MIDFMVQKCGVYEVDIRNIRDGGSIFVEKAFVSELYQEDSTELFEKLPLPQSDFVVYPGAVSSSSTVINCQPFVAGVKETFHIELRDTYGNIVFGIEKKRIKVVVQWVRYTTCQNGIECDVNYMPRENDTALLLQHFPGFIHGIIEDTDDIVGKDGYVQIGYTALKQGATHIHVLIDDKPIDTSPIYVEGRFYLFPLSPPLF